MKVRFWGTRGSLASPGAETARYGGNTSCVEVRGRDGTLLVLDAGTGIRRLGAMLPTTLVRVILPGGHHFSGDYEALAGRIIDFLKASAPPQPAAEPAPEG